MPAMIRYWATAAPSAFLRVIFIEIIVLGIGSNFQSMWTVGLVHPTVNWHFFIRKVVVDFGIIPYGLEISTTAKYFSKERTNTAESCSDDGSVAEQRTKREGVDTESVHNVMPSVGK
ncbi:hypothetical protein TNCV_4142331 [Trichonephila clavipes]|nr:hypothetical protein TNCV_4142331 [Trichonephila clavipes]